MTKNCSTCLNLQFGTKENNQQNKFVLKCKFGKMLNPFLQFYSCKNYKRKPFRTYDGIETLFSIKSKFYKDHDFQRHPSVKERIHYFFKGLHTVADV